MSIWSISRYLTVPPIALRNVMDHPGRSFIAILGMGFAVVMVFLQLGFLEAVRVTARTNYESIPFDLVMLSTNFHQFFDPGTFPRDRLRRAEALDTVRSASPLYTRMDLWRCPTLPPDAGIEAADPYANLPLPEHSRLGTTRSGRRVPIQVRALLVIGVELDHSPYAGQIGQAISRYRNALRPPDSVLFNTKSNPDFGTRRLDKFDAWELAGRQVRIVGTFEQPRSFGADGTVLCGLPTFASGLGLAPEELRPNFGFLTVEPGTVEATRQELARRLPSDVHLLSREELARLESDYWVNQTATGIIFRFGSAVTLLVAAVVIYQVLASDVRNRLSEYATLKAMGWSDRAIGRVVLHQAAIYAMAAFIPAALLSWVLYRVTETLAGIPMLMTAPNLVLVGVLTLAASLISGRIAVRKLKSASPAELF